MPNILVVDDDEVDRELAERCLKDLQDLELSYARDGQEALESLEKRQPDLILTDLRMPRVDGLELVERVRESFPAVPVVLMTAQGSEQIAMKAIRSGAASYVPKGDLKTDLAEVVDQILETSEARKSARQVLGFLTERQSRFELENDPHLITALGAWIQESLERLGFANETVRSQIGIALIEAVSNAMIHGNLEIGSELRRGDRAEYYRRIEERRKQKPFSDRRVHCVARESRHAAEYVIADDGPGFDRSTLPDPTSPDNVLSVSGRGVWLIRNFMDEVEYNDRGNEIHMIKKGE